MDYYHFNGNQTVWSNFNYTSFNLLDYYKYSTNSQFIEAHYVHNFSGIFLSRVPLIRKAKLNEIAGFHCISSETLPMYYEISVGVEKLDALRVDFVTGYSNQTKISSGIRLGLQF